MQNKALVQSRPVSPKRPEGKNSVLLKTFFDYGEKRKRERRDREGGRKPIYYYY
jgi:hypothetical protein